MENKIETEKKCKKSRKEYMDTFYNKIKNEKYVCEICYGNYTYFNKPHHLKTKRHLKFVEMKEEKEKE